jgi:2-methylcitrate dehydratase PrpD
MAQTISEELAGFASDLTLEMVPHSVIQQAILHLVDSVGLALASSVEDFAPAAVAAATYFGRGTHPIIGGRDRVGARDAALINGIMIHGLDFDDTHLPGVIHTSASALPTSLAMGIERQCTTRDVLLAYILAMEVGARVAMGSGGGFQNQGFHTTGVAGAFGAAIGAGRLAGLDAEGLVMAQGFVGSLAAGLLEFLEAGAWTKRAHPGWAAVCGLTAAAHAAGGYVAPRKIYEGRYGLYSTYCGVENARLVDLPSVTADLGARWEISRIALKPYPTCHLTHAFADAAIALADRDDFDLSDVDSVECLITPDAVHGVCEPREAKRRPKSSYEAKFSLPYVVATSMLRRQFGLNDLEPLALQDRETLALAEKVMYSLDPDSGFPVHFSGEVRLHRRDGSTVSHREQINRGAEERPLSREDVLTKFNSNAVRAVSSGEADRIRSSVEGILEDRTAMEFAESLAPIQGPSGLGPQGATVG